MNTKQQKEILSDLLKGKKPEPVTPKTELLEVTIPIWQEHFNTYNEAVQFILDKIKESRPFYNWREGQLGPKRLRESDAKKGAMAKLLKKDGFYTLKVQMGEKYKGKSVEDVRKLFKNGEFGLGAFEVGCILLTHPEILKSSDDLWIDCPGDEYDWEVSDARFDRAPVFNFDDGEVRFGTDYVGRADGGCGSASGFVSQ